MKPWRRRPIRICCFGDSITRAIEDPAGGGWVGRLGRESAGWRSFTNRRVVVSNCGVSGDKVADVLSRFNAESSLLQPDLIVIAVGINDVPHGPYPGTSVADLEERYRLLISAAQKMVGQNIVVVSPTNVDETLQRGYRNTDIVRVRAVLAQVASEFGVPFVDVFGLMATDDLRPDGLHPGASGHDKLYRHIRGAVRAVPAISRMTAASSLHRLPFRTTQPRGLT